jgi:hypothetical protein
MKHKHENTAASDSSLDAVSTDASNSGVKSVAALSQADWQPIETAPKDGTDIIVAFAPEVGWLSMVKWFEKRKRGWCWVCSHTHTRHLNSPTHWMPLPSLPSVSQSVEPVTTYTWGPEVPHSVPPAEAWERANKRERDELVRANVEAWGEVSRMREVEAERDELSHNWYQATMQASALRAENERLKDSNSYAQTLLTLRTAERDKLREEVERLKRNNTGVTDIDAEISKENERLTESNSYAKTVIELRDAENERLTRALGLAIQYIEEINTIRAALSQGGEG